MLLNCAVARQLLQSAAAFDPPLRGLDWSDVPSMEGGFSMEGGSHLSLACCLQCRPTSCWVPLAPCLPPLLAARLTKSAPTTGLKQEEIVNMGIQELVLNAFVRPA